MNANEAMTTIGIPSSRAWMGERSRAMHELVDEDEAEQAEGEHREQSEHEHHGV
jgi:hypothetical protein